MASVKRKVEISCAVTRAIHPPSMSPYLSVTPDEIIANVSGAAEAGAAVLPLYVRKSHNGRPDRPAEFSSPTRGAAARQQSSKEEKP